MGLEFGIGAALGYLAGDWLDERWGTRPWLALVLLVVGIGAAFASLVRLSKEVQHQEEHNDEDGED